MCVALCGFIAAFEHFALMGDRLVNPFSILF